MKRAIEKQLGKNSVTYTIEDSKFKNRSGDVSLKIQNNVCIISSIHSEDESSMDLLLFYSDLFAKEKMAKQIIYQGSSVNWQSKMMPYIAGKVVTPLSPTETINPRSRDIDQMSVLEALAIMNREDKLVAEAIETQLPQIAGFIEALVIRMKNGGRLFYIGAGTSGRLGVLDASECPPTFSTSPDLVIGLIAGGDSALRNPIEGAEDDESGGEKDLIEYDFGCQDSLVGIAASGNTPYVCGALRYAATKKGLTAALTSNPNGKILSLAEYPLAIETGPELISGSTRLKSGTMQKLVLNMITTIGMVQQGKVYSNLMVDVKASNEKLNRRAYYLLQKSLGCSHEEAEDLLCASNMNVKTAILMGLLSVEVQEAKLLLASSRGKIRDAVKKT